ncbi:MAG TPA: zf-TFIIB domain-containing protein, partial [Thermoguttaceae bacterium]|nr:zf-TFIIB domain-containing protein [Thermoguttaceae bacterium]
RPASLHVDTCDECRFVWLDGGELGRLQLSHEMTEKGQEARRFRKRLATMSAEERAQFEENLANLPDENAESLRDPALEITASLLPRLILGLLGHRH